MIPHQLSRRHPHQGIAGPAPCIAQVDLRLRVHLPDPDGKGIHRPDALRIRHRGHIADGAGFGIGPRRQAAEIIHLVEAARVAEDVRPLFLAPGLEETDPGIFRRLLQGGILQLPAGDDDDPAAIADQLLHHLGGIP